MKEQGIKIAVTLLITSSFFIPNVHAQETEITTAGDSEMLVSAQRDSSYTVAIPKTLDMGKATSKDFTVQAKGNLSPKETLVVTVDQDVDMARENDSTYQGKGTATLTGASFDETALSDEYVSVIGNIVFTETKAGTYNGKANFTVTVEENNVPEVPVVARYELKAGSTMGTTLPYKDVATSISFDRGIPDLATLGTYEDVSLNKDGTIIAYLDDENGMHIVSDGVVKFNENSASLFRKFSSLTSVDFNGNVDTSEVKNMSCMFMESPKIIELDLRDFNTQNVEDMHDMFSGMWGSNLERLNLSSFDTSRVRNMTQMFYNTGYTSKKITVLDVSSFDTRSVETMDRMFVGIGDNSLQTIYVGKDWITDNVQSSSEMVKALPSLIGGAGTVWDSNNPTDKTYARVDGGVSNPGYFTLK